MEELMGNNKMGCKEKILRIRVLKMHLYII